jgi:RNA polymerase sigma factor (sigma-70 family)
VANDTGSTVCRTLRTLWTAGAVGEIDDRGLLERFRRDRGERSEVAFRILVERHGPMVQRVCRQVLGDEHDARDATQAVFLILARKAGSIRAQGSVAPWLHGVARRVASKARARDGVRRTNEARTGEALARLRADSSAEIGADDWAAIHEEVGRLPEKYRTPVVLCYLEGQTYDEAARRIGCPVGTIRVRLSRARASLRDRLTRRGYAPSAVGALGGLEGVSPAEIAPMASGWVEATVKSAVVVQSGRATVEVVSTSALVLSQVVMRGMFMTKVKFAAIGLMSAGILASGAGAIVGQTFGPAGQRQTSKPDDRLREQTEKIVDDVDAQIRKRSENLITKRILEAAMKRAETSRAYYEEGRITIDRYLDALEQVRIARTLVATNRQERIKAALQHRDLVADVLKREQAELSVGRSTAADVAEAQLRNDYAELEVLRAREEVSASVVEALKARVESLERKLEQLQSKLNQPSDAGIDPLAPRPKR